MESIALKMPGTGMWPTAASAVPLVRSAAELNMLKWNRHGSPDLGKGPIHQSRKGPDFQSGRTRHTLMAGFSC